MVQGRRRREGSTIITMKPGLPEEIVLEILWKLPIRSVVRFKCVSKRWPFLISDPKFNVSVQRQSVIVVSGYKRRDFLLHCINDDGSVVEIPRLKPLQIYEGVKIEGSCNGLLLLKQGEDFFLWNPLTGFCNRLRERLRNFHFVRFVSGLCYDSSTGDYKTNEFVKVPMPECDRTREEMWTLGLGVLNGCLSLAKVTVNVKYYNIEVLVMKKYAKKESWTSFFVISEFPGLQRIYSLVPLCCMKDMVLLLQRGSEIDVILAYDLNKKSHWDFPIPRNGLKVDAAMFVESLVSPPSHYEQWRSQNFQSGGAISHRHFDSSNTYDEARNAHSLVAS